MKRWIARLGLALLGILGGLVGAEVVARAVHPGGGAELLFNAPSGVPAGIYSADGELGMVLTPGFVGEVRTLDYSTTAHVNSLGLRGAEPSGGAPWLVLGDSFTLALQVEEEDTFVELAAKATGQPFWNAGVDGDSTWRSTGRYLRRSEDMAGVVLTFFLGNDLSDNRMFPRRPPGTPARQMMMMDAPVGLARFLFDHSALYAQLRVAQRRAELSGPDNPQARMWRTELGLFHREGARDLQGLMPTTRQALQELAQVAANRGDRLFVLVAPPVFQVDPRRRAETFSMVGLDPQNADLDAPRQALLGVLHELNIPACDPTPALEQAAANGEDLYFRYDAHWNERGHQIAADALVQCLKR